MALAAAAREEGRFAGFGAALLLLGAIVSGSLLGLSRPEAGERLGGWVDPVLMTLMVLLFFEMRLKALARGFADLRFLALAWGANFLILPFVGFALAALFLSKEPLLAAGLVIYCLSPCTDWFLGFIRLAKGDAALGAALIPLNLISQLLLYPVFLWLFLSQAGVVEFGAIPGALAQWFLAPFLAAQGLRLLLERLTPKLAERLADLAGAAALWIVALVVFLIFAANIGVLAENLAALPALLGALVLFFLATLLIGEGLGRAARLASPQQATLALTLAARNAPMMLGLTAAAIPDQPAILAAIAIGMLIEFPHLTALKQILLSRSARRR